MSNDQKQQWPLYNSNENIRALQIKSISEPTAIEGVRNVNVRIVEFVGDYPSLELLPIFMEQYTPQVGGYLVQEMDSDGNVTRAPAYLSENMFNLLYARNHEEPRQPQEEGMSIEQESKYGIRNNRLYNRATGQYIPEDEPVFIFRGRDRFASQVIQYYADGCANEEHKQAVYARVVQFIEFATEHSDRMKDPDTQAIDLVPEIPSIDPAMKLRKVAHLIGSIFAYGGFKAETMAERELEKLLTEVGYYYPTRRAAIDAAQKAPYLVTDMSGQKSINGSVTENTVEVKVDDESVPAVAIAPPEVVGVELEDETDVAFLQKAVSQLYGLLDDVDTAEDRAKDDNAMFRALVQRLYPLRKKFIKTDGQKLFVVK